MKARVAERGQVTIPKELRSELGIKPGTVLDFKVKNGQLLASKEENVDPIEQAFGCLGRTLKTDQIIRELRGAR